MISGQSLNVPREQIRKHRAASELSPPTPGLERTSISFTGDDGRIGERSKALRAVTHPAAAESD